MDMIKSVSSYISTISDFFIYGMSDVKLYGLVTFFLLLILLRKKSFILETLFSKSKINHELLLYLGVFSSTLGFFLYLHTINNRLPIFYSNNVVVYSSGNSFEYLLNPLHNHLLKPSVVIILNLMRFKFTFSNYDSSLVFLDILPLGFYYTFSIIFLFMISLSFLIILKKFSKSSVLSFISISLLTYIFIKNVVDGGLFWYEFISSSFLLYLVFTDKKLNLKSGLFFLLYFVLFEYSVTYIFVGPNKYYLWPIIGSNFILFSLYFGTLNKTYIFLLYFLAGLLVLNLGSTVHKKNITLLNKDILPNTELLVRTKKSLDSPIYKEYKYFTDYIYTTSEKTTISKISTELKENMKYDSIVELNECKVSEDYEFSNSVLLSTDIYPYEEDVFIGNYFLKLRNIPGSSYYRVFIYSKHSCEFMPQFTYVYLIKQAYNLEKFFILIEN